MGKHTKLRIFCRFRLSFLLEHGGMSNGALRTWHYSGITGMKKSEDIIYSPPQLLLIIGLPNFFRVMETSSYSSVVYKGLRVEGTKKQVRVM